MEKVQLITANDDLAIKLQRHLGESLIHTDSVDNAIMNVSGGAVGTTIIHGYEKMSVLLRIVTFLRDACPSMAITCLVKPENVTRVMNSELKPYIYRVLPNNTSAGQIVLAVNSSQKEHQALQEREALGENLTVQLDRKDLSDALATNTNGSMGMRLILLLMLLGSLLLAWFFYNQQTTVKNSLEASNSPASETEATPTSTITVEASLVTEMPKQNELETLTETTTPVVDDPSRQISSLLLAATNAQLSNQLVQPFSNNAAAYYQQVLMLDSNNQSAQDGMQQVQLQLVQRINDAFENNQTDTATADFLALRSLAPDHPELANIRNKLLGETHSTETAAQDTTAIPALSPARLQQLEQIQIDDLATTRLAQIDNAITINAFSSATNLLLRPRNDLSAYENEFQDRTSILHSVLTRSIQDSILSSNFERADILIDSLSQLGYRSDVDSYRQQISTITDSTASPIVEDIVTSAKVVDISPPVYPRMAERRGIGGYVLLRYRVLSSGEVTDIEVLDNQPSSIFDQAAINSIQASTFTPATRNGVPEDQTIEQRVNFQF